IVLGWNNDGKRILFRSRMRSFNDFIGQLFLVNTDGSLPEQVELPRGGFASFSPDDSMLAYNRIFREFRTWKRYRGGLADEVWVYDFATKQTTNLTNNDAVDDFPMWAGNRVYFLSDRDAQKRFNLYSVNMATKAVTQHAQFTEFE